MNASAPAGRRRRWTSGGTVRSSHIVDLRQCSHAPHADCDLPPTFQSWFTVTNLHVWLLTVRLRALPKPLAQDHIQGLIDHFFFDVEDRIRLVLSPAPKDASATASKVPPSIPSAPASASPSTPTTAGAVPADGQAEKAPKPFYTTRNPAHTYSRTGSPMQWAGLGLALDLALVRGDTEMSAALWRNLMGAYFSCCTRTGGNLTHMYLH
jgi:cytochrome b pre-mRNA-processing protein 3